MPIQTCFLGPSGGNNGSTPTAGPQPIPQDAAITGFVITSDTQIYQITINYDSSSQGASTVTFGAPGPGGSSQNFPLAAGEFVTQITGYYEDIVQTIRIKTSLNNVYSAGSVGSSPPGSQGQQYYQYDIPPTTRLAGFWGMISDQTNINALGIILFAPAVE